MSHGILLVAILLAVPIRGVAMEIESVRVISSQSDIRSSAHAFFSRLTGSRKRALFERPYGVAWEGDALLVTDPGARRVTRIEGSTITMTAEEDFESPVGVAACNGRIFVSDSVAGEIVELDHRLRRLRVVAGSLGRPTGLACAGSSLYVVETTEHRILVIGDEPAAIRSIGRRGSGPGEFNYPATIAASGGSLFIGDTLNFRIQQIGSSSGVVIRSFGGLGDGRGDTPRIKGIAVDAWGRLWVTDAWRDRISVFDGDSVVAELGESGNEPGELAFPAGIAIAQNGSVAVVDSLNRRVQIFTLRDGSRR